MEDTVPGMPPILMGAAFADNVVPLMSPLFTNGGMWYQYCTRFLPTAAFPDNVVPVMSPFLADGGIPG